MSELSMAANGSRPAGASGDWSQPGRFALALAILIAIPFCKVLTGLDTFVVRDFGLYSYPCALFQRQCFWKGELPFWNPYSCCGLPFLAQLNTMALYPPALIYLLLPLTWSLPFFCLLHLFWGGFGMYYLAERWSGSRAGGALAGVVFAFNGLSLNFLMWPSHIATFAWMPWVIFLTESGWRNGGRALAVAAVAGALQALAGGPETILFTWLILLVMLWVECRRGPAARTDMVRRFFLTGFLAACLAAAQLLPCADLAMHSQRNTHYGASDWAMPVWGWGNFLAPMFQTYDWQGMAVQFNQYWTSSYYVGISTIFLAIMAFSRNRTWRIWLAGAGALAALVLALGDNGFIFLWLRKALPFLGLFRFPIKFVIVTSALLPLLAACAVKHYEDGRRRGPAEVFCGAGILAAMGGIVWFAFSHPAPGSSGPATLHDALPRLGFLAAFLGALWFFAARPAQRHWSVLLPVIVCWLDLLTAMPWQNPAVDPSVYQSGLGLMTAKLHPVPALDKSRLMISSQAARQIYYHPARDVKTTFLLDRSVFLSDCNLLDNVPKVDGFFPLYLRQSGRVLWLPDASEGAKLKRVEDFLGVSQTIATGKVYDWVPRTNFLPTVTIGQEPVFANDETAFDAIGRTNVDFSQTVYLPPEAKPWIKAQREPEAKILGARFDNNKETIQVATPGPAMVYISDAYYHNWQARVDGKAVPLWRANYAFQAVATPAGTHTVTLVYRDKMFFFGTLLAVWAGFICLALWKFPVRQNVLSTT